MTGLVGDFWGSLGLLSHGSSDLETSTRSFKRGMWFCRGQGVQLLPESRNLWELPPPLKCHQLRGTVLECPAPEEKF